MFNDHDTIPPIPELPLTLAEVNYLLHLVMDHYDEHPATRASDKQLGTGLLALWTY